MLALAGWAQGHGGMVFPEPRNAAGQKPWGPTNKCNSQSPYSTAGFYPGEYCGLGCVGDSCLWYQIGCFVGCGTCSMTGKDLYPTPQDLEQAGHCKPITPTNNKKEHMGYNIDKLSTHGDWSAVNPWRAPGTAGRGNPAFNPCGISSGAIGYPIPPATGTKQGMNGTDLPASKNAPVWSRGSVQNVEWGIYANHAGGYAYRLCKKGPNGEVTETACQEGHLPFVGEKTTVKYYDGSRQPFEIDATTISNGTFPAGSMWRLNPVPMCNCDLGQACSNYPGKSSDQTKPYPETHLRPGQTAERCPTGLMFPTKWDDGHGSGAVGKTFGGFPFTMQDQVKVPEDMAAGEYVLSWRWDCEQTPQVWNSCADINVQ